MRNVTASRLIKPKIGKEFYMVKIYVVDTNVLIQAPYAIESFEDNEVVLPMVVIEELDHLKKAEGEVGMNARRSIRCLEQLRQKADLLYAEIDRNPLFVGTAAKEDRSDMNVCFVMAPGHEALQDEFLEFAKGQGMLGIKGHRSVGGFRASIYNACPLESVQALVKCMQDFESMKK